MHQKQKMLERIDNQKGKFEQTFRNQVDQDVKELKHMGELEYNFNHMLKDIKQNRDDDVSWLHDLINKTINDERVVH